MIKFCEVHYAPFQQGNMPTYHSVSNTFLGLFSLAANLILQKSATCLLDSCAATVVLGLMGSLQNYSAVSVCVSFITSV